MLKQKYQINLEQENFTANRFTVYIEKATDHYRDYLPLLLSLILIIVAWWGYNGTNTRLLGPPLGVMNGQDFRQVLRASAEITTGKNPYTHALLFGQTPNFKQFMDWNAAPYPYPPIVAVFARPLLWLETHQALKLWTGINFFLLTGGAILAVLAFKGSQSALSAVTTTIFVLTLFFTYAPTQLDLMLVQLDILILFLLISTYFLYAKGYNSMAGVPLALAVAVKPIVAPMILYFAWKRQWRIFSIAVCTAGLITIIGFSVAGWSLLPDYLMVNRLWASGGMLSFPFNQSIKGFTIRLFTSNIYNEPLYTIPWLAQLLPILFGLAAIGWWMMTVSPHSNPEKPINGVEYGLTLTTLMFLSPLIDDIHFVWTLMPLAALLIVNIVDLRHVITLVLLSIAILIAIYLGLPDLHNAIYIESNLLRQQDILVARNKVLFTGAYLYGLIALNFWLVAYINWLKRARQNEILCNNGEKA